MCIRFFIITVFLLCSFSTNVFAEGQPKKDKDFFENYYEIPFFIEIKKPETKADFMKRVMDKLQGKEISFEGPFKPRSLKYLDENNEVTRSGLETFKDHYKKELAKYQTRQFFGFDKDGDQNITLTEFSQSKGFAEEDVYALYDIAREYGFKDMEQLSPIIKKLDTSPSKTINVGSFVKTAFRDFLELDLDGDRNLSLEELGTPSSEAFARNTKLALANFESYLSLSKDGNKVTLGQISKAASRAFNTLDYFEYKDDKISEVEFSAYLRGSLHSGRKESVCSAHGHIKKDAPVYMIAVGSSNVTANFGEGYTEVVIEKQEHPLNLVLSSTNEMIWSIKGDTSSLETLTIFGPEDTDNEILAGVTGIEEKKIKFLSSQNCWDLEFPIAGMVFSDEDKEIEKNKEYKAFVFKARGVARYILGEYPHLVRQRLYASKITIKGSPVVEFQEEISDDLKSTPAGYSKEYWDRFLSWKKGGHKNLEKKDIVFGAYIPETKLLPFWAGVAQLEHEGVIETVKIDDEKRRAEFLLKKDLPEFLGRPTKNPYTFIFIADDENIRFPDSKPDGIHTDRRSMKVCIKSREGEIYFGEKVCLKK